MSAISKTSIITGNVINPIMMIFSSSIIIIAVMVTLVSVNPTIAIALFTGLGTTYFFISLFTTKKLQENSQCIAQQSTQLIKAIQEGLGGIRDVLIGNNQQFFSKLFSQADIPHRRARGNNVFISGSPRFVMESVGIILIAGLAYFMSLDESSILSIIPILGVLIFGAQRLLPSMQQIYYACSNIHGANSSLTDVINLLDREIPSYANEPIVRLIQFNTEICLNNISFRYTDGSMDPSKY